MHISEQIIVRPLGALPRNTEIKPREQVREINLSGKDLTDSNQRKVKILRKNIKDGLI